MALLVLLAAAAGARIVASHLLDLPLSGQHSRIHLGRLGGGSAAKPGHAGLAGHDPRIHGWIRASRALVPHHRGDGTASEDDNVLAQGIGGAGDSIGYFGFAYFQDAGQSLKAVSVDAGEGCVAPSFESALDGSYPLSRPLYIYTRELLLAEHPVNPVLRFVEFYLDNATVLVAEVGYVSLPPDVLQAQKDKIAAVLP